MTHETNRRVRCPMEGRGRVNVDASNVGHSLAGVYKIEIDQEPCQSNIICVYPGCINVQFVKFGESVWICVFFEHEKFSYIIGLAFVRAVVSLLHSLGSQ